MAEDIGKLTVDFEANINDFKIAISEVKSLMKDMGTETRKSTGDFALLAGVTAGVTNFGLNVMKEGIQGVISGIEEYLQLNPDFVIAQTELDQTFRELANEVGPGATGFLEGWNELLKTMGPEIELVNGALELMGKLLSFIAEQKINSFDNLKLPTRDEIIANNLSNAGTETTTEIDPITGENKTYSNIGSSWGEVQQFYNNLENNLPEAVKQAMTEGILEGIRLAELNK